MAFLLRSWLSTFLALLMCCAPAQTMAESSAAAAPDDARQAASSPHIFAIGDLHGDHAAFRAIVAAAGLVDADGTWIGGDAIMVQTGDVPDRGPDSLLILHDLMRLQDEADAAGGRVIALIGNHEAMNATGDLRYVSEGEYAAYSDRRSENRRRSFYEAHQDAIESAMRQREATLTEEQVRQAWFEETPLGELELLEAWGPQGEIGRWLAGNPAVALIGDALFVHGGISESYSALPIAEINARTAAALAARDTTPEAIINDPAGPLWYRGYFLRGEQDDVAAIPPEQTAPEIDRVLAAYGARRIVVGHTPSLEGIRILPDGRLIAIDTGISAFYGGVRSYLEISGETVTPHIVGAGENP